MRYLKGFYYSLPIQLMLLHFRRYQILLLFWFIFFSVVNGSFMRMFGASSLFLSPEYLNNVSPLSTAMVGGAIAIFLLSWNITTFILHTKQIRFLATTAQPFLKYCINNSVIPVLFLVFYCIKAVQFDVESELLSVWEILFLILGFLSGFLLIIILGFTYFFSADKTIYWRMKKKMKEEHERYSSNRSIAGEPVKDVAGIIRVDWFLSATFKIRKPRNVDHYSQTFIESIFKRHHIAAVISIFISFAFLLFIGFFMDNKYFQLPAAASITILFAVLLSAIGALNYFLQSWAIPIVLILLVFVNYLYENDYIDLRNKAYGLNYTNKDQRPNYDRASIMALASDQNMAEDKAAFISILNKWKARQDSAKPKFYIINTSGGGLRSACFTINMLQRLDSMLNGKLMQKTALITGASGGMFGAAYYRELYYQRSQGKPINLLNKNYVDDIGKDLLNPLFSSFVTRDIIGPTQKFSIGNYTYNKDRGYAFEQELNENTHGILNKKMKDYAPLESNAQMPTMFFNSVVTRDGRKMIICSHPVSFMMRNNYDYENLNGSDADAIDFMRLFAQQEPQNLKLLTALRMNATFPYVLPNVWLPTNPVIDVMDAGLRDNFGQETALRFVTVFKDWIKENTSGVVLIELRDRTMNDWDDAEASKSVTDIFLKPATLLQNNWYKMQDYFQETQLSYAHHYLNGNLTRIAFQYISADEKKAARLNFHLTQAEKKDIEKNMYSAHNQKEYLRLAALMK